MGQRRTRVLCEAREFRKLLLSGACLAAFLAADPALARQRLIPEQPSVEVNLEVIEYLQQSTAPVYSDDYGDTGYSAAPQTPLPERRVPRMNQGMSSAPQQATLPPSAQSPLTPRSRRSSQKRPFDTVSNEEVKKQRKAAQSAKRAAAAESRAKAKPKAADESAQAAAVESGISAGDIDKLDSGKPKADKKAAKGKSGFEDMPDDPFAFIPPPPNAPASGETPLPSIDKLSDKGPSGSKGKKPATVADVAPEEPGSPDLPEPDFDNMTFQDFPDGEKMPEPAGPPGSESGSVPVMPNGLPDINKLQEPAPKSKSEDKKPKLEEKPEKQAKAEKAKTAAIPRLPQIESATTDGEVPVPALPDLAPPEMPALPDVPTTLPPIDDAAGQPALEMPPLSGEAMAVPGGKEVSMLPPVDVPEGAAKAEKTKAAAPKAKSGEMLLSIEYPKQETQVPVSNQKELKDLAKKIVASGQAVRILGIAGGEADQALAARRAAYSRAMLVRAYLIDNGVSHFNININTRPAEGKEATERVDIVTQ